MRASDFALCFGLGYRTFIVVAEGEHARHYQRQEVGSLFVAVAGANVDIRVLLGDLKLLGFLFESLVVRDLRVYAQAADARVFQYCDSGGLEVDAIVEARDCRWMAFEMKLGQGQLDDGAWSLKRFVERLDTARCGPPALLGVIVASGYAYRRKDGVAVIPIGALGP